MDSFRAALRPFDLAITIEKAKAIVSKIKRLDPPKYEWRRLPSGNRTSATAWSGSDEVGHVDRIAIISSDLRWEWSVTADLANEFRDQVVTEGSTCTLQEAAALTEQGYDKLMLIYDKAYP